VASPHVTQAVVESEERGKKEERMDISNGALVSSAVVASHGVISYVNVGGAEVSCLNVH
jgi:hypothetical protein